MRRIMAMAKFLGGALLLAIVFHHPTAAFIGVDIRLAPDAQRASDTVRILKANNITHVRLYDANPYLLKFLGNTSVEVIVGVTNEELLSIGKSLLSAAEWIKGNVSPYVPATKITAIAVGNEVLTAMPSAASVLLPAMNYLHRALVASNLSSLISISTPQSFSLVSSPFPPSSAFFNSTWKSEMSQILQFLKNTNSNFMLNANVYHQYVSAGNIFPIEYVLFQPLSSSNQVVDPSTLFSYNSMLEAMIDASYCSMEALNFSTIPIVVTETGWPFESSHRGSYATIENAETFVDNLIKWVVNGSGSPTKPTLPVNAYIFELLNEDANYGSFVGEKWGLFNSNWTAAYAVDLGSSRRTTSNSSSSSSFCVAKPDVDQRKLIEGMTWACGLGGANCRAIQTGGSCFQPNNVWKLVSYAYNDYYQRMSSHGGTCDFSGTATISTSDPSYGNCVFSRSSNSHDEALPPVALGPINPSQVGIRSGTSIKCSSSWLMKSLTFVIVVLI